MDTILASIRRILNEDEVAPAEAAPTRVEPRAADVKIPTVPNVEALPKADAPKADAPRVDAPRADTPRTDAPGGQKSDVFVLKEAMMVPPEPSKPLPSSIEGNAVPVMQNPPSSTKADGAEAQGGGVDSLVAARTRAAAAQSFDALHEALRRDEPAAAPASPSVLRAGGPSVEDLVRDELRALLSTWLDVHLPGLVEALVRSEIEKLTRR